MKAKFVAASAALAVVLGLSAPALAVDCDPSTPGNQPPGDYIASAVRVSTLVTTPFGAMSTAVAAMTSSEVAADDKPGIGGDMQTVFSVGCDIGSKADQPMVPSTTTTPMTTTLP